MGGRKMWFCGHCLCSTESDLTLVYGHLGLEHGMTIRSRIDEQEGWYASTSVFVFVEGRVLYNARDLLPASRMA